LPAAELPAAEMLFVPVIAPFPFPPHTSTINISTIRANRTAGRKNRYFYG